MIKSISFPSWGLAKSIFLSLPCNRVWSYDNVGCEREWRTPLQASSIKSATHRVIIISMCLGHLRVTLVVKWCFHSLKYLSFGNFRDTITMHDTLGLSLFCSTLQISPVTLKATHYRLHSHKKEGHWILKSPLGRKLPIWSLWVLSKKKILFYFISVIHIWIWNL